MNKLKIHKDAFLSIFLVLSACLILWKGYSYDPESRQFPVFLGWIFLVFSLGFAVRVLRNKRFKAQPETVGENRPFITLWILALIALYAAAITLIGYYEATFLFLFLIMIGFGNREKKQLWIYSLVAALFLVGVYVFFVLILGTRLSEGELWALLGE